MVLVINTKFQKAVAMVTVNVTMTIYPNSQNNNSKSKKLLQHFHNIA